MIASWRSKEVCSQAEYKSIEINPTVDPKLFEKPAEKTGEQ